MLSRLSERARKVISHAHEEALRLGNPFVSSEHILYGIVKEPICLASYVLQRLGLDPEDLKKNIDCKIIQPDDSESREIKLSPGAKRVVSTAAEEADNLGSDTIGSEHLLIGIVCEQDGLGGKLLTDNGITLDDVRREVSELHTSGDENILNKASNMAPVSSVRKNVTRNVSGLKGISLTSIAELTPVQALEIINVSLAMKIEKRAGREMIRFKYPKILAMIFERPSLRTRATLETAMIQMGGDTIFFGAQELMMGKRENAPDIAANLSRWCDAIAARVNRHDTIVELDDNSNVPVINALSDLEHPCQALGDMMTFFERRKGFEGKKLAWVGDGNTVCHSVILLAAQIGLNISVACPKDYAPNATIVETAKEYAAQSGSTVEIMEDPAEAVRDADAIYTKVWNMLGKEISAEDRRNIMMPYQVNKELMSKAKKDAIAMHCMPAHRGEEITSEILDGPNSAALDQAENRLHAQKALLALVLGEA